MLDRTKRFFWGLAKWSVRLYIFIAALVGTCVMAWPFVVLLYNGLMAPAPLPVYLPNSFIYDRDSEREGTYYAIYDQKRYAKDRKRIVIGDVRDVMWHEDTIYGFRRGLAKEPYYYICTFDQDCSHTQHLSETDFIEVLKTKDLPAYESRKAQTYDQLLWEQSKTYQGDGP